MATSGSGRGLRRRDRRGRDARPAAPARGGLPDRRRARGSITVALAVAAATTLLPALFGVLGLRVLSRRERRRLADRPARSRSELDRALGQVGAVVQRRPAAARRRRLARSRAARLPALSIRLGSSDQGNDPAASTTRKAYDLLADGFGAGHNGPLLVVAQHP